MTEHEWSVEHKADLYEHRYRAACTCGWRASNWYAKGSQRKASGVLIHYGKDAEQRAANEGLEHCPGLPVNGTRVPPGARRRVAQLEAEIGQQIHIIPSIEAGRLVGYLVVDLHTGELLRRWIV